MPKVSVIMPIYNAERYLDQSIPQVLNQTLKDIEIICVDDGSTDTSLEILKEYALQDARIKVLSQEHASAGAARNRGLKEAKGEYLSFLDVDDMFEPNMLDEAYQKARLVDADIVVFKSDIYNENLGIYSAAPYTIKEYLLPGTDFFSSDDTEYIFSAFSQWAWDKLFRREFVENEKILFQDQVWINDACFVLVSMAVAERMTVLNRLLIHKRINNSGAITSRVTSGREVAFECFCTFLIKLKSQLQNRKIFDRLENAYLNYAAWCMWFNIDKFLESPNYIEIFECVKKKYLKEIGLDNLHKNMFYDEHDFDVIHEIINRDALDYKWYRKISRFDGTYLFPFELVPKGSEVILYGAGKVGISFYRQITFSGYCKLMAWVDKNFKDKGKNVSSHMFTNNRNTFIVVAIANESIANEIKKELLQEGCSSDRIIWKDPRVEL